VAALSSKADARRRWRVTRSARALVSAAGRDNGSVLGLPAGSARSPPRSPPHTTAAPRRDHRRRRRDHTTAATGATRPPPRRHRAADALQLPSRAEGDVDHLAVTLRSRAGLARPSPSHERESRGTLPSGAISHDMDISHFTVLRERSTDASVSSEMTSSDVQTISHDPLSPSLRLGSRREPTTKGVPYGTVRMSPDNSAPGPRCNHNSAGFRLHIMLSGANVRLFRCAL